ncbi:hypothetical protein PHMEG_00024143 [Phytophthora megakarya]|uniref:Uncharacterized protein n=1 Tax=Phytophthora megakarya TaxID=4795 RepID=A0A225VGW7_9STRA|nr:hypothetical protein PHMEG_00024143 [Phytophthora megakarya]
MECCRTGRVCWCEAADELVPVAAFLKDAAIIAVVSDASDLGWGLVVTQMDCWDSSVAPEKQHLQLLVCKSGVFDETERRWTHHIRYLLIRPTGFRLFCDHKNLIYVFSPTHEVKRHVPLTGLSYCIEHINGAANGWTDLLSRWSNSSSGGVGMRVN